MYDVLVFVMVKLHKSRINFLHFFAEAISLVIVISTTDLLNAM